MASRFDGMPKNAREKAIYLDSDYNRDVFSWHSWSEECGCIVTTIEWQKDFGEFEDVRYTKVYDRCDEHSRN